MTQRHDPERTNTQLDRVIDAVLRELVEREAPHDLHSQIMTRVDGAATSSRSFGRMLVSFRPATAWSVLFVALVGGLLYWMVPGVWPSPEPTDRPRPTRTATTAPRSVVPTAEPPRVVEAAPEAPRVGGARGDDSLAIARAEPDTTPGPRRVAVIVPRVDVPVVAGGLLRVAPLGAPAELLPTPIELAAMALDPLGVDSLDLRPLTVPAI